MWYRANAINLLGISLLMIISMIAISWIKPTSCREEIDREVTLGPSPQGIIQKIGYSTKDLWLSKKGRRFRCHIESPESRLILKQNAEIVEDLREMKLWIEEPLLSTTSEKEIRYISAPHSTFHYARQKLCSENASILLFNSPHKEFSLETRPDHLLMKAFAEQFDIELKQDNFEILANGFRADFDEVEIKR